mgnify:FL=1
MRARVHDIYVLLHPNLRTNYITMRRNAKLIMALFFTGVLMSCIGDELPNTECDIEEVTISVDNPKALFYHDYDATQVVPSVENNIIYLLRAGAEVGELPVTLKITEGARAFVDDGIILPDMTNRLGDKHLIPFVNGSSVDFSDGRTRQFRIVSEDGMWDRQYTIHFEQRFAELGPCTLDIDFEDYYIYETVDPKGNIIPKYYIWTDNDPNAIAVNQWVTGNPGFNLSKSSAKPDEYPSVAVAGAGVDGGSCLKLETKDTGAFGRMVNYPIAAGSFFIGTFDVENALKNALIATRFGLPFAHKPVKMTGYYKFKAGAQFQDKKSNPVDRIDQPDAYCVVYRNTDSEGNRVLLDGADVLSNPNIVGLGRITDVVETDEWTEFDIPMVYTEEIDDELLVDFGYSMTICFSSSIDGAYFEGAPGSTFFVDKVKLECEY